MRNTSINIKTEKQVKDRANKVAHELGVPLSTVLNAYLRHFIREKDIHFSLAPQMTPELTKIVEEARIDYKKGINISPIFSSGKEMDKYLKRIW